MRILALILYLCLPGFALAGPGEGVTTEVDEDLPIPSPEDPQKFVEVEVCEKDIAHEVIPGRSTFVFTDNFNIDTLCGIDQPAVGVVTTQSPVIHITNTKRCRKELGLATGEKQ